MSFVWGQLPVLTTLLFLALAISQALCFVLADDDSGADLTRYMTIRSDPVPGTPALLGLQEHVFGVGRRDCLANGTNFCFNNNVDSCSGCGNCCRDGDRKYCCAAGRPCCGSGCCLAGQICSSKGDCVSSVETVTITKTIFQTTTRIATQRATILVVKIESSTVVSTVDVTVSSADTQTNIVWKTATVTAPPAKRSAVVLEVPQPNRNTRPFRVSSITRLFISFVLEKNSSSSRDKRRDSVGALLRRQNPSTTTITKFVTEIADIVSTTSTTITTQTTSTFVTTVFQTNTRVLHALATIVETSTLTITSRPPAVRTITTTASLILPPLTTPSNIPSPSPTSSTTSTPPVTPVPPQSLSTTTIAGIAVGSSALALILAALIIFFIRRRRYQSQNKPASSLFAFDPNDPEHDYQKTMATATVTSAGLRQPTLPRILPHFAPAAPAHHHSQPPALTPSYQHQQDQQHRRNSSGFTTLVGTPPGSTGSSNAIPVKSKGKEYRKSGSSSSPPIAEVQGSEVPVEGPVEVEGSPVPSPTASLSVPVRGSGSGSRPVGRPSSG